ncbi:MAG: glycosyltransferase [Candidatus Acidiferrales bacterium]
MWGSRRAQPCPGFPRGRLADAASRPEIPITIIICTHNRANKLRRTLEAVLDLDFPAQDYEVIVVDNGSTDGTAQVCHDMEGRFRGRLQIIHEPVPGAGRARNTGLHAARGSLIACLDDDIIPRQDWLRVIQNEFGADPDLAAISGRVELLNPADLPMTIRRQTDRIPFTSPGDAFVLFVGCNEVVRREVYTAIGFYDPDFGPGSRWRSSDDSDFIYRAWKAGDKLIYVPSLFVYHDHGRRTSEAGLKLRRDYAVGRGGFYAKHILLGDILALKCMCEEMLWSIQNRALRYWLQELRWLFRGFTSYCLVWSARHLARALALDPYKRPNREAGSSLQ